MITYNILFQDHPQPEERVIELEGDDIEAALSFAGATKSPIGGFSETKSAQHAASYFSGYIAMKLNNFHKRKLTISMHDCEGCDRIFVTQDLNLHLFVSFKEYNQNVDSS